jgi:hypothetical protein
MKLSTAIAVVLAYGGTCAWSAVFVLTPLWGEMLWAFTRGGDIAGVIVRGFVWMAIFLCALGVTLGAATMVSRYVIYVTRRT